MRLAEVIYAGYGKVLVLHIEGGVEWRVVRLEGNGQRPCLGDKLRIADSPARCATRPQFAVKSPQRAAIP